MHFTPMMIKVLLASAILWGRPAAAETGLRKRTLQESPTYLDALVPQVEPEDMQVVKDDQLRLLGEEKHHEMSATSKSHKKKWIQLGQDIDSQLSGDSAGWAVAVSRDGLIVAVGEPGWNGPGSSFRNGVVKVHKYNMDTKKWTQVGKDINGVAPFDYSGSAVSLSRDGTIVAIGTPNYNEGYVQVYKFADSSWTQIGANIVGDASYWDFGSSVSLSDDGSIVAVGASSFVEPPLYYGGSPGVVRVYKYDSTKKAWFPVGQEIKGENINDAFGSSVSLSRDGTVVAVGAPYDDESGKDAGLVQIFKYHKDSKKWKQRGGDIGGEAARDLAGTSVSISKDGTIVAIGAMWNSDNGNDAGDVRVFKYNSEKHRWSQLGKDIEGEAAGDFSGKSVSLSSDGKKVAIGSPGNDDNGEDSGHARVYKYSSSSKKWVQVGSDIKGRATGENAGFSVALSGDAKIVTIGAPFGGGGDFKGSVQVFKLKN